MSVIRKLVRIAAFLVVVGAVWVVLDGTRDIRELDRSIAEQILIGDSLRAELRAVDVEMKQLGQDLEKMPEHQRMGTATKGAFKFAKRQEFLEGRITRSRAKIKAFEKRKSELRGRMTRRALPLGLGWLLLMVVSWRLPRS